MLVDVYSTAMRIGIRLVMLRKERECFLVHHVGHDSKVLSDYTRLDVDFIDSLLRWSESGGIRSTRVHLIVRCQMILEGAVAIVA